MNKTTEIIKLKDEIKELKAKLLKTKKLKLLLTQPLKRTNSCPPSPLKQNLIKQNIKNKLPFIHRKTSTQTSSLSEAAVNLSFPSQNINNNNNNNNNNKNENNDQLSPICEMKSNINLIK